MHIVNLLQHQRRPATSRFTLNPGWPCLLQAIQHLAADLKSDMLPGMKTHPLAQPDHPGAQDKHQHQYDEGEQEGFAGNIVHDHMLENASHDPGLSDNQYATHETQQA